MAGSSSIRAGRAYVELFARDGKLVAGLKRAQRKLKAFGSAVSGIGLRMAALGAAGAAGIYAATASFAKMGDELGKMSKRTGFSVEALSELSHVAAIGGTDIKAMEIGFRRMMRSIYDAGRGLSTANDALAEERFTHLAVDVADAVQYRSHPKLRRKYTVPMSQLRTLATHARKAGLDVIPKLNFSQSVFHQHNHWMLAPGQRWSAHFDDDVFFRTAFELIDELIAVCQPKRYVHIGMDEDHLRSYDQYVEAVKRLRNGLRERKLRTMMWNDSAIHYGPGLIHRDKALAAEKVVPKDVVQMLWNYYYVPTQHVRRIARGGFELWGAPGHNDVEQVRGFCRAVSRAGGKGLMMTRWDPCRPGNRAAMLRQIRTLTPVHRGEA